MSAPRANATRLSQGAVSPEMTIDPAAVSKRKANAGNTGACCTRMAVTRRSSSSVTSIGSMGGATAPRGLAPTASGMAISQGTISSVRSRRPASRMRMLRSKAWAATWWRVMSTTPGVGLSGLTSAMAGSSPSAGSAHIGPADPGP